jgi:hypothetical protein
MSFERRFRAHADTPLARFAEALSTKVPMRGP